MNSTLKARKLNSLHISYFMPTTQYEMAKSTPYFCHNLKHANNRG